MTKATPLSPARMLFIVWVPAPASTGVAADSDASNTDRPTPTRMTAGYSHQVWAGPGSTASVTSIAIRMRSAPIIIRRRSHRSP